MNFKSVKQCGCLTLCNCPINNPMSKTAEEIKKAIKSVFSKTLFSFGENEDYSSLIDATTIFIQDFTSQQLAKKEKEIKVLTKIRHDNIELYNLHIEQIQSLKEEVEGLKVYGDDLLKMLRECAMRANVSMPETEDDVQQFEEQFSGNPDFSLQLFKVLKQGNFDESFKNIVASEEMEPIIESAVYGMCPKCKENMTRCACSLPSWDEIVKKSEDKKQKQIDSLQSTITTQAEEIKKLREVVDLVANYSTNRVSVFEIKRKAESLLTPKEESKEGKKQNYCDCDNEMTCVKNCLARNQE